MEPIPSVAPIVAPRISDVPQRPAKPAAVVENDKLVDLGHKTPPASVEGVSETKPAPAMIKEIIAPTAPAIDKADCSEISKIDRTSQDTIKQFTKAVNEKISVSSSLQLTGKGISSVERPKCN